MDKSILEALKTCGAVFIAAFAVMYLAIMSYVAYAQEMNWPVGSIGVGVTAIISGVLAVAIVAAHMLED